MDGAAYSAASRQRRRPQRHKAAALHIQFGSWIFKDPGSGIRWGSYLSPLGRS